MPLNVTPPRSEDALWSATCRDHGILAEESKHFAAVMVARLHEFEHGEICVIDVSDVRTHPGEDSAAAL